MSELRVLAETAVRGKLHQCHALAASDQEVEVWQYLLALLQRDGEAVAVMKQAEMDKLLEGSISQGTTFGRLSGGYSLWRQDKGAVKYAPLYTSPPAERDHRAMEKLRERTKGQDLRWTWNDFFGKLCVTTQVGENDPADAILQAEGEGEVRSTMLTGSRQKRDR